MSLKAVINHNNNRSHGGAKIFQYTNSKTTFRFSTFSCIPRLSCHFWLLLVFFSLSLCEWSEHDAVHKRNMEENGVTSYPIAVKHDHILKYSNVKMLQDEQRETRRRGTKTILHTTTKMKKKINKKSQQ